MPKLEGIGEIKCISIVKYQNIVCAFFGGFELSDFYDKARDAALLCKIIKQEVMY